MSPPCALLATGPHARRTRSHALTAHSRGPRWKGQARGCVQAFKLIKRDYQAAVERDLVSSTSTLTSGGACDALRPSMLAISDARWQRMKEAARHIVWPGHVATPRRHANEDGGERGGESEGSDGEDAAASKAAMLGAATRCAPPPRLATSLQSNPTYTAKLSATNCVPHVPRV